MYEIDEMIIAHIQWKQRLVAYIANPDHSLTAASVGGVKSCQLGEWIEGKGCRYSGSQPYARLREAHAKLHEAAAKIITRVDAAQNATYSVTAGARSDFWSASREIVVSLMALELSRAATLHERPPAGTNTSRPYNRTYLRQE
jgi:methyl-accepting chemotaxis protein